MSKPALNYTLQVSLEDDTGRITITSDEVPGLLIWAPPQEAFADVHESVKKLRLLNARAEMETPAEHGECPTCRAGTGVGGERIHLSLCPASNRRV